MVRCDIPRVRGKDAEELGKTNPFALTEIPRKLGFQILIPKQLRIHGGFLIEVSIILFLTLCLALTMLKPCSSH